MCITQLNHDGTTADYIDYAANTMAIWQGVANKERAEKIVARIAKGNCTGAGKRGTWVSERPFYGFDQDKVVPDKVPKLQGDSTSAEGRVALMDARARIAMGDADSLAYFNNNLLGPIQDDLLQYTWLTERYTCDGLRERTPFFFEYPCLLSIMLKEMKYGIDFGLVEWSLAPIAGVVPFRWSVGRTDVSHHGPHGPVLLSHPGSGARQISVAGLTPGAKFVGTSGCGTRVTVEGVTTAGGVARWNASDISCGASVALAETAKSD